MTEAEWLACNAPVPMQQFLLGKASDRKLQLFLCACCRRIPVRFQAALVLEAIDVSEQYADGVVGADARDAAFIEAERVLAELTMQADPTSRYAVTAVRQLKRELDSWPNNHGPTQLARCVEGAQYTECVYGPPARVGTEARRAPPGDAAVRAVLDAEVGAQVTVLRDIVGNPFRPVAFSPDWRTSTAVALASQMYDSRDFSAMPILADAIQDAGCDNADILAHCRGPGPHVRGCWVVDLVRQGS